VVYREWLMDSCRPRVWRNNHGENGLSIVLRQTAYVRECSDLRMRVQRMGHVRDLGNSLARASTSVLIPGRRRIPPCSLRSRIGMTRAGIGALGLDCGSTKKSVSTQGQDHEG
jgi:hypothetical protein